MAPPVSNGLFEVNGAKSDENGFGCMKLIEFLTKDGVTDWDEWHYHTIRHHGASATIQTVAPYMQKQQISFYLQQRTNEENSQTDAIGVHASLLCLFNIEAVADHKEGHSGIPASGLPPSNPSANARSAETI